MQKSAIKLLGPTQILDQLNQRGPGITMNLALSVLIISVLLQSEVIAVPIDSMSNDFRIAKRAADPGGQYYRRRKSYRPRRYYKSHRNNNIGNILATKAVVGASALGGGLLALGLANGGLDGISIPNIGIPNIGIPNIGIGIPNLGNIIPAVSLNQNGLQFTWNGR